jgi:phosphomannomutase
LLIRSVSGVRGLTGTEVTPALARRYGRAFGRLAEGSVLVGWDSRAGGGDLSDAIAQGLTESGRGVLDGGIAPTPTIGVGVRMLGLGGGVVVTASHNPQEYNGLKFFGPNGTFLDGEAAQRLFSLADNESGEGAIGAGDAAGPAATSDGSRSSDPGDLIGRHIDLVLSSALVDRDAIARLEPLVVVDCVNAAGSLILPRLLRALGCRVSELNTEPGAGFPRGAEPLPENLADLGRAVVGSGAAVGLACDPDADRLAIVDEKGVPIGEEYTLAIAARVVLESERGPVVANVSTSRMLDDLGSEFDVPVHRTPIGEINVVSRMLDVGAVVGGEGNGGVILPDVHMGRDAATGAALILTGLAHAPAGGISGLADGFVRYSTMKTKIAAVGISRQGIVEAMDRAFPDGERVLVDGAKIVWPDRWIHARMSGTEPVIRVIAEASRPEDAAALVEAALAAVKGGAREA